MLYLGSRWTVVLLSCLAACEASAVTVVTQNGVEYVQEWETPDPGEGDAAQNLNSVLAKKIDTDYGSKGLRSLRDAHPKAHGCVVAQVTVNADLPASLQTPLLQPGQSYDAIIRFSSASATPQSDATGDGRGMAIKLFNVPGQKLLAGQENATTHDFVMINYPIFPAQNAIDFMGLVNALVANNPLSYFIPSINPLKWKAREAATLAGFNGKKDASLLQQRFFSLVPALLGEQAIKYGAEPCSNDTASRPAKPDANFLRAELQGFLTTGTGCFDFEVQPFQSGFAIEDGMGWWPAGLSSDVEPPVLLAAASPGIKPISSFVKVAHITIPPQTFDTAAKNTYCDNLSFTNWHAIPEHRPLGGINRARRVVYPGISAHRHAANGVTPYEPSGVAEYQALN